jgi:uncharacterized protein
MEEHKLNWLISLHLGSDCLLSALLYDIIIKKCHVLEDAMFDLFRPTFQANSLDSISVEKLKRDGISGLIIDLDNTMTPWNDLEVGPKVTQWFQKVEAAGIRSCVVSNNKHKQRVAVVAERLGIPFVFRATKPRRKAFRAGMEILGTGIPNTAVIGDQLFTDILGGNRLGLYTILVLPISDREFIGTRFLRQMERVLVWLMKHFATAKPQSPKVR